MPFIWRSGFLLFNPAHVFSISGERRLDDSPNRQSAACLIVSKDIGKAEAMSAATKTGAAAPGKHREGGLHEGSTKEQFLSSFPEEGISSYIFAAQEERVEGNKKAVDSK